MAKQGLTNHWAKVTGLKEVMRKVKDIEAAVDGQDLLKVLMSGAKLIEDDAKSRVPVDTGWLKGGIYSAYGQQKNRRKPSVIGGVNYSWTSGAANYAPYAHILEFGSVTHTAQPFFGPAIKAQRQAIANRIKDGLQKILDEKVKR